MNAYGMLAQSVANLGEAKENSARQGTQIISGLLGNAFSAIQQHEQVIEKQKNAIAYNALTIKAQRVANDYNEQYKQELAKGGTIDLKDYRDNLDSVMTDVVNDETYKLDDQYKSQLIEQVINPLRVSGETLAIKGIEFSNEYKLQSLNMQKAIEVFKSGDYNGSMDIANTIKWDYIGGSDAETKFKKGLVMSAIGDTWNQLLKKNGVSESNIGLLASGEIPKEWNDGSEEQKKLIEKYQRSYALAETEYPGFANTWKQQQTSIYADQKKEWMDGLINQSAMAEVGIGQILEKKGMYTRADIAQYGDYIQQSDAANNTDNWQHYVETAIKYEKEALQPPDDKTKQIQEKNLQALLTDIRDKAGKMNPLELRQIVKAAYPGLSAQGSTEALKYVDAIKPDGEYDAMTARLKDTFKKDPAKMESTLVQLRTAYDQQWSQPGKIDREKTYKMLWEKTNSLVEGQTQATTQAAVNNLQGILDTYNKDNTANILQMVKSDLPKLLRNFKDGTETWDIQTNGKPGSAGAAATQAIADSIFTQNDALIKAAGLSTKGMLTGRGDDNLPIFMLEATQYTPGAYKDKQGKYWFAVKPDEDNGQFIPKVNVNGKWVPLFNVLKIGKPATPANPTTPAAKPAGAKPGL